jgi:serine/threonine protein phosphatase PrpC
MFFRGNAFVRVGACGMQGFRDDQEDAEALVMRLPNHPDTALCGVFDGHGGNAASKYGAEHVPLAIDKLNHESLFVDCEPGSEPGSEELCHAILDVDTNFLSTPSHREGSTAVFALMRPRGDSVQVTVANVGDSRCLWIDGKTGQCMFSTSDHKPFVLC